MSARMSVLEVHREWVCLYDNTVRELVVRTFSGREYRGIDAQRFHLRSQGLIDLAVDQILNRQMEVRA